MATDEDREAVLAELDQACYAASTNNSRDTLWETWTHFAETHWSLPPLPLTRELVRKVAGSMRAGGLQDS